MVCQFDVTSGVELSCFKLQSQDMPYLWAHEGSFRILVTEREVRSYSIRILQAGQSLTRIESFHIESWGQYDQIKSFSPATCRISFIVCDGLRILDIQNLDCLLEQEGNFNFHSFSSDGSCFAASSISGVHIWKYASGAYALWMELSIQDWPICDSPILFSPTLPWISGWLGNTIQVQHLDGPPITAHQDNDTQLTILSPCGTFVVTHHKQDTIITITNLCSPTHPWFIDTDIQIDALALTGNILLVWGGKTIVAWRLTKEGAVHAILTDRRAGHNDRIWTISFSGDLGFSIEDQTVAVKQLDAVIHTYHTETGEVLKHTPAPFLLLGPNYYTLADMQYGRHYPHYCNLHRSLHLSKGGWPVSRTTLKEGWVKDPGGEHWFWIPVDWRAVPPYSGWLENITTLWVYHWGGAAIIMF